VRGAGCVPCECNDHGDESVGSCHNETGVCYCTHNTHGHRCQFCDDGYYGDPRSDTLLPSLTLLLAKAQSETVYAGMVYRHFFGRLEIIPPLLSGRLPYPYAVGHSTAAKFKFTDEIWSVDCEENH